MDRIKQWLKGLKEKNWHYKLLSIGLAFVIWFYITDTQQVTQDSIYTVPLEYRNLADEYAVTDMSESVRLVLSGSRINVENLSAYVDCGGLTEGEYRLEVQTSVPSGLTLISVNPSYVTVTIKKYTTVEKNVKVQYRQGNPAEGYTAQDAVLDPAQVSIHGAQSDLDSIGDVYVLADISGLSDSLNKKLPVNITDKDGNMITGKFEITPGSVQVFIPILSGLSSKEVPVTVTTTGTAPSGAAMTAITADPANVTVYGKKDDLAALTEIKTEAINISDITATVTKNIALSLPSTVQFFGDTNIMVTFTVESTEEENAVTVLQHQPIQVKNGSSAYTYKLSPDEASLTVQSGSENNPLYVDVNGLEEGTYDLSVMAAAAESPAKIEPEKVTVTITKNTE